jgi:hypothetical protein
MASLFSARILELMNVFPGFTWEDTGLGYEVVQGTLNPFGQHTVLEVAAAIAHKTPYQISADGSILIDLSLLRPLKVFPKGIEQVTAQTFTFEMFFSEQGRHPDFYSIAPLINRQLFPLHRHLYLKRRIVPWEPFADALCVYAPHEAVWQVENDSLSILIAWLSHWFANHAIWQKTDQWLGDEASHDPKHVWNQHRHNECHCGSGKPMKTCHPLSSTTRQVRSA